MLSEIRRKLRFLLRVATGHSLSDCYAKGLLPDTHCRVSQTNTTTKVVQTLRQNIGQKSHDEIWRVFSSWSHEVAWAGKTLDAPPFPLSPFYIQPILPPRVLTLLCRRCPFSIVQRCRRIHKKEYVCIVVGGPTLSVTFAGQPVKGTKRILTTENKSSFPKIQTHIKRNLNHIFFHFLCREDSVRGGKCLNNKCGVQKKSPRVKNAFCLLFCRGVKEVILISD